MWLVYRLKVLRDNLAKALPGKSIAVLDPQKMLVTDIFLNQDGHAQERTMLPSILETIQAQQVWIADRNFCTRQFLFGIVQRSSDFVIRQHKSLPVKEISSLETMGETKTGGVFEQQVQITAEFAQTLKQWATSVNLKRFCSSPRQKKKPKPKPTYDPKHPHRSTARLLQQHKQYKRSP